MPNWWTVSDTNFNIVSKSILSTSLVCYLVKNGHSHSSGSMLNKKVFCFFGCVLNHSDEAQMAQRVRVHPLLETLEMFLQPGNPGAKETDFDMQLRLAALSCTQKELTPCYAGVQCDRAYTFNCHVE
jgi:hypothetical protein